MNKIKILSFCLLVLFSFTCIEVVAQAPAQSHNNKTGPGTWEVLNTVDVQYNAAGVMKPNFNAQIKALAGKTIELKGYMIPITQTQEHTYFILSALPANACYFHGEGGPGTVIEVKSKKPIDHSWSRIVMRGTLQLNQDNEDQLLFIMNNAELVKE